MHEPLLSIGEFAARSRLSPKALRHYDELGLLAPVRVAADTGYRWYSAGQLGRARLVSLLRHLDMPLARIGEVLELPRGRAADAVRCYWAEAQRTAAARANTVRLLCHLLEEGDTPMEAGHRISLRAVPERALIGALRHVTESDAGGVMGKLLARMRTAGPGLAGLDGCPFLIFHGEVGADSDGPVEVVRPCADLATAQAAADHLDGVQARTERSHDEAFVRLTLAQAAWPAGLDALNAIAAHLTSIGRTAAGPPRQIMIADWRTARADEIACVLSVPLQLAA